MKQKQYKDGTPSREIEEDWESTGAEEMHQLHEKCKQKTSVLDVRDRLGNLLDLITVCRETLSHSELIEAKHIVTHVLYFYVEEEIKTAEKELANL